MSVEEVYKSVYEANNGEIAECILYSDIWNFSHGCRMVKSDECVTDIATGIKQWGLPGMFKIDKVIDYGHSIDSQLPEEDYWSSIDVYEHNDVYKMDDVRKAIKYATFMHRNQQRKDGTPYIRHPLSVLNNVYRFKKSHNIELLLASAALHDTLEDTEATYSDIVNEFGLAIGSVVLELTTNEQMKQELGKERYLEIKMRSMTSWALVVKLCDRLDNVSDLLSCDDKFRNKYINETIGIISYLFDNVEFSKTHILIIEEILIKIFEASYDDKEKIEKIQDLMNKCISIKKGFGIENNNELKLKIQG